MKLVCTLKVIHRNGAAHGQTGNDRANKVLAQLRRIPNRKPYLLISSNKDITGQQYAVENVQRVWKNFLHEGKMTIELRDPEVNLMFYNAREEDLIKFLEQLYAARSECRQAQSECLQTPSKPIHNQILPKKDNNDPDLGNVKPMPNIRPGVEAVRQNQLLRSESHSSGMRNILSNFIIRSNQASTGSAAPLKRSLEGKQPTIPVQQWTGLAIARPSLADEPRIHQSQRGQYPTSLNPHPKTSRPAKRAKLDDPSAKSCVENISTLHSQEMTEIRKALKTNIKKLEVSRREQYPLRGFSRELEYVRLFHVSLRNIDSRLLNLKYLKVLNLTGNCITSIECLASMESHLAQLNLDENCIDRISEDLFCSDSLKSLNFLSLAGNKLTRLPRSIIKLQNVETLILSRNVLRFLPYNMHYMRSLRRLLLNDNKLTFLPFTMQYIRLIRIDLSRNLFPTCVVRNPPVKVQINTSTTLFELAAERVKTHNYEFRLMVGNQIDDTSAGIPAVVYDALEMCKYCVGCRRMVMRYRLLNIFSPSNLAEETIRDTSNLWLKKVLCLPCCGEIPQF